MTQLILGLILFLGAHSVRIWADGWRNRTIEAYGDKAFKGIYTLVSLLGFYLLVVWALSHLLANGNLADLLLFGSFLIWAVLNFRSARARDRAQVEHADANEDAPLKPNLLATLIALFGGMALWAVITVVLHAKVVGVAPMG
ncbi:MAG: NnrU family protein [Comamonadaceae bacterium]|nr:NnrU family protein [Comamonadaceae bacterium]